MNIRKLIETVRLKLEHHHLGQLIMLLIVPFYVRPHHFWNAKDSIFGRISISTPILVSMLYRNLSTDISELLLHNYARMQTITLPILNIYDNIKKTSAITILLTIMIAIYSIATIQYFYNNLMHWFWRKMKKQVNTAPYAFYVSRQASWALWFYFLLNLIILPLNQGVDSTVIAVTNFLTTHSNFSVLLLLIFYFSYQTIQKNSISSSMELYGSKWIVAVNTFTSIIFLLISLKLLTFAASLYLRHLK